MDIYVNYAGKENNYPNISSALESASAGFSEESPSFENYTPSEKTFPEETSGLERITIHIAPGTYREKLIVTRPNVTFLGESKESTVIVFGHGANEIMPDGTNRGTFRTASVRIDTHDFCAKHIAFQNDAGYGHTVGQALAIYIDGDRNSFFDCAFIASQDTIFTAPLPEKEAKPGGFRGPGEFTPRILGRHYFKSCFIQGDVDFIFGSGIALFEDCEIFSKFPEDRRDEGNARIVENSDIRLGSATEKPTYGYVSAASTYQGQPYGYVFKNCRLTSDCPAETIYLGRPWREWAKTVFINCDLGAHIKSEGWQDWNKPHGHFLYAEYNSTGAGAAKDKRVDFSRQLTDDEVKKYTMEQILEGWNPMDEAE